jgi:hypothetical protein
MSQTFLVQAQENRSIAGTEIRHRTADVDQFKIFYREAGVRGAPAVLLLHGFPTASHMFRVLIPLLAGSFTWRRRICPALGNQTCRPRENFIASRPSGRGVEG